MEEVQYYTHEFIDSTIIPALDGGVIKSDDCVDEATHAEVKEAVAALREHEGVSRRPEKCEVDIVDPHLFPFAWEKTRLLRNGRVRPRDCATRCGEGDTVRKPAEEDCREPDHGRYRNDMAYSRRFQWLPFEVAFEGGGTGPSRYPPASDSQMWYCLILLLVG